MTALSERIQRTDVGHPVRACLDGPGCALLGDLAAKIRDHLQVAGRPTAIVAASDFYRDASLRLEFGRTDIDSYYSGWLDLQAVAREVLSAARDRPWSYLPSLRDPVTNRSTRATPVPLAESAVVLVTGELLLGHGLDFDITIHADVSRAARRRRTTAEWQWTLPAFDRYDIDVDPCAIADVVVRYDDPARPAI